MRSFPIVHNGRTWPAAEHPELAKWLLATGNEEVVEDCTSRPAATPCFWGAALRDGVWVGESRLGVCG